MEFTLFAPHVEKVELVGSWLEQPVPLEKGEGGAWRAEVEVPDGRHCYKFRLKSLSPFLDGATVEVADPLARAVDEASDDASLLVVQGGRDVTTAPGYAWRHDDVLLPQDNELVIYELHVGEFTHDGKTSGTFARLLEKLDYLRDLGVNALELMPVKAYPGRNSWGYTPRHFTALESAYGTPEDFKRLVDECHARGMRVILDMVFNHSDDKAPLTQIDFYYWYRDTREDELYFGPKLDYERFDDTLGLFPARKFAAEVAAYWIREYHVDGYRLDAAYVIDNFDVLHDLRRHAKEAAAGKPFYLVAEHLPENPAVAGPDGPADGAWHQRFELQVVATLCEGELRDHFYDPGKTLEALDPRNHGYAAPERVVHFLESHDEITLMRVLGDYGITGDKALRKNKLGAALLFTAVGNPLLYQGQEFGGHRARKQEVRPLQWDLLGADYGRALKEHYAFLARLRHGSPALKGAEMEPIHLDQEGGVIAYRRGYGEAEVLVVANLRDEDKALTIPFPDGRWRELTFGYDIDSAGGRLADTFPASSAKIYVRRG